MYHKHTLHALPRESVSGALFTLEASHTWERAHLGRFPRGRDTRAPRAEVVDLRHHSRLPAQAIRRLAGSPPARRVQCVSEPIIADLTHERDEEHTAYEIWYLYSPLLA